jgi:cobalt-zinc-cadmium efflux system outer membrane protein
MKRLPAVGAVIVLCALSGCRLPSRTLDDYAEALPADARSDATLVALASSEPPPPLPESPTLQDYLAYAALANPGLKAAFRQWQAALERVPQVTSLPDPMVSYRYYIQEVETRVGPQEQAVGLQQKLPWFGKLDLQGRMAAEEAESARQRYDAARLALFYAVKDAYCEYYYLARAIGIVGETRDLVRQLEGVARAQYRAAAAPYSAVVKAQVELGKLEDRLSTLEDLRGPMAARLNAALNRPPDAPVPWPDGVPQEAIAATDERILAWAAEGNPDLAALAHAVLKQERAVDLAEKAYFPDITLGLDYIDTGHALMPTPDNGKDPVIAMVSVNVPIWWDKYRAGEREARARHLAAEQMRGEAENALNSRIKMVLYRFRDAERKVDLFRDTLVPMGRQSLEAAQTAFRAGTGTFLDLVDAERILLEFQLSHQRALADQAQRLAELEMLVGRTLPRVGPSAPAAEQERTQE